MAQAFNFQGTAAAITGAASGIGRALALGLASKGADLAILKVDSPLCFGMLGPGNKAAGWPTLKSTALMESDSGSAWCGSISA